MDFLDNEPSRNREFLQVDDWDAVVNLEGQHYEEGLREGQEAARTSGIFEEGRRGGFLKGYAVGFEIGFMSAVAEMTVSQEVKSSAPLHKQVEAPTCDHHHDEPASSCCKSHSTPTAELSIEEEGDGQGSHRNKESRQVKRMLDLQSACDQIPLENNENIDFDEAIAHLRSLYKQAGSTLGTFPPVRAGKKEVHHDW